MKKTLVLIFSVLLGHSAFAADIPSFNPSSVSVQSYDWSGFSVGVFGGVGGGDLDYPVSVSGVEATVGQSAGGGFLGAKAGFDYQVGGFVVGLVGDIAWSDIEGEVSLDAPGLSAEAGSTINWLGTVRGRVGYAFDTLLVYATGGGAAGEIETYVSAPGFDYSVNETHYGWTVGAGLELAVNESLSLTAEYLYVDLDAEPVYAGSDVGIDVESEFHTLKAGLSYRF